MRGWVRISAIGADLAPNRGKAASGRLKQGGEGSEALGEKGRHGREKETRRSSPRRLVRFFVIRQSGKLG